MSDDQTAIQLSKRELQVLEMVATGASNQEIARQLVISVNTVKVHMRNIFEKLGVQSRTEATLRAIQDGLVVVVENEAESDEEIEATSFAPKTYLIETGPPLALPHWQQLYLTFAALLALAIATLPLLPKETRTFTPDLPVIYRQPTTPTPPAQPRSASDRWSSHAPMPTSRAGLALVSLEEQIFAIGGVRANNRATRSVEIFDTTTDTWIEGATKPTATANIAGVVLDDKIYVPGGCTNDGQAIDSLEIYDPEVDSWSRGKPLPEARCAYGLVALQDKLYLFGGWNGKTFEDTIFVFSPKENIWTELEATMPHPIGYVGASVLDEAIYIVGGYDGQDEFNTTYSFSPKTNKWLKKSPLHEKRGGLGLISSADNLYAVGGGWEHPLNTSEKYDPQTDTWTTFETPFASQWRNLGLTVIDTKIYAVGGWDSTEEKFMDSVVSYQFLFQLFLPISGF